MSLRSNQYGIFTLMIATGVVALLLVYPWKTVCGFFAFGSAIVFSLCFGGVRDAWRTSERSERRLLVPLGMVLIVSVMSFSFWSYLLVNPK